jgi:hypothetical protein
MSARVRTIIIPILSVTGVALAAIGLLPPVAEVRTQHGVAEQLPIETVTAPVNLRDALIWLGYGAPRGVLLAVYVLTSLVWYAAALSGPLLLPVLGQRLRFWTRLTHWSLLLWIALTMLTLAAAYLALLRIATTLANGVGVYNSVTLAGLLPGVVVTPLGLALCLVALVLLRTKASEERKIGSATPARQAWWVTFARVSAGVVTLGAVIWALGLYALSWATTASCEGITISFNHFAHGSCAGLDFADALARRGDTGSGIFEFLAQWYPLLVIYSTLLGWAILMIVRSWRRLLPPEHVGWMALWILVTGALSLAALDGVSAIREHGHQLTAESSGKAWMTGPGVEVSLGGLILITAGVLCLGIVAWRDMRRPVVTAEQTDTSPMWYAHP